MVGDEKRLFSFNWYNKELYKEDIIVPGDPWLAYRFTLKPDVIPAKDNYSMSLMGTTYITCQELHNPIVAFITWLELPANAWKDLHWQIFEEMTKYLVLAKLLYKNTATHDGRNVLKEKSQYFASPDNRKQA